MPVLRARNWTIDECFRFTFSSSSAPVASRVCSASSPPKLLCSGSDWVSFLAASDFVASEEAEAGGAEFVCDQAGDGANDKVAKSTNSAAPKGAVENTRPTASP